MIESIEGIIIGQIHEHTGLMPSEILARKYTPDMRFLWRYYFAKLKAKRDQMEELEE